MLPLAVHVSLCRACNVLERRQAASESLAARQNFINPAFWAASFSDPNGRSGRKRMSAPYRTLLLLRAVSPSITVPPEVAQVAIAPGAGAGSSTPERSPV
jgi:hypothetical protein